MGLFGFSPDSTTNEEKLKAGLAKQLKTSDSEQINATYEAFCERVEQQMKSDLGRKYWSEFGIKAAFEKQKMTPQQRASVTSDVLLEMQGSHGYPRRWEVLRHTAHGGYGSISTADKVIKSVWTAFKERM